LTAYYALVFAFALLGLVANVLLAFCTVVRTRLIMYFTCPFLALFVLVGFVFLIGLAFMQPQMAQMCSYADKRLVSGIETQKLITNMGYPHFADKIAECM